MANCKTDQEKEKIKWTFFQGYCENESDCWNLDYTENGGSFWCVRLWSGWRNICLVQFWNFLGETPPISLPDATWPFWGLLTDSQSLLFAKTSYNSFPSWLAQMLKLIQPTYICKYEERKKGKGKGGEKIKANDMRPKSGGCETAGKLTDPPSMKACASRHSIMMIIKPILAF